MTFQGQDAWRNHPKYQNLTRNPPPGLLPAMLVFGFHCGAEHSYLSTTTPQRVPRAAPFASHVIRGGSSLRLFNEIEHVGYILCFALF